MPISKNSISSPLEAGTSLLQPMQLPSELLEALEYVSKSLVRKRLHLSLIVVKRDHQLQSPLLSKSVTAPGSHPLIASPTTLLYNNAPLTSYIRDISPSSRRSSSPLSSRAPSPSNTIFSNSPSERSTSTTASTLSSSTIYLSRTKYSGLPSSPKDTVAHHLRASISPSTPCTPTTEWTAPDTPNRYGITLMHSITLTPRVERILRTTISRAEKKFPSIGGNWLSTSSLSAPITDSPTQDLIHRSLSQNRLVFTSAGLSLYSLDYLYTFKCALHVYSRSLSEDDMKIAIDELRRLVLIREGNKIDRKELGGCYEWMGISLSALCDVEEGYRRVYGGGLGEGKEEGRCFGRRNLNLNLVVRTSFVGAEDLVVVGESAKGRDGESTVWGWGWGSEGLEGMEDKGPFFRGDRTPNRVEDFSPGTRGEWEFLMRGERSYALVGVDC